MRTIAANSSGHIAEAQAKPLAGLVCAFRFHDDGTPEELNVDRPIAEGEGWLWLHFNLADARSCHFLNNVSLLPPPANALLVSADEHQQLHATDACLYGILADLVCGLDGITEDIGFLHFAFTKRVFISSRRHQLNAVDATRKVLRRGLKVQTPSALLEAIAGQMIESLDRFADGLASQLDRAEERILADEVNVDRQLSAAHDCAVASATRHAAFAHPPLRARHRGQCRPGAQSADAEARPTARLARHGDCRTARPLPSFAGRDHAQGHRADQSQPARACDRDHRLSAGEPGRRHLWHECRGCTVDHQ
jgi:Mg2+ and Co2+ transporter CorA